MAPKASIVLGLQFGDEGKGITTDYLCSQSGDPRNTIVVRFSGGQQAGHTVQIGDKRHVHASFGSGTLRGVPSYFSEHCTIYPPAIMREAAVLASKGITPELFIHPLAKLTTPWDVKYNHLLESQRGHGSCGMGIGTTMKRHLESPYKLYAVDILHPDILRIKMDKIGEFYTSSIMKEYGLTGNFPGLVKEEMVHFNEAVKSKQFHISSYGMLTPYHHIIFEGSQGILLDMDHGIFPNVTYANTTSKNAREICNVLGITDIETYYVTRCYQTRHGAGWMSNESPIELINNADETNVFNEWQKNFRVGELDYDLLQYAFNVDRCYNSNIINFLERSHFVVTCLDQRPSFIFDHERFCFNSMYYSYGPSSSSFIKYTRPL